MTATRRQLGANAGRAVVAISAVGALASCVPPVAVAPRRHSYLIRILDGYRRDLVVCDASGNNASDIVHGAYGRATWAPNGQYLAVSRGTADDSLGTWALWVVRSDGALPRRITNPPSGVADLDPSFAPDGQTIAFSRDTIGFGYGQGIWLVQADGTGVRFVPGAAGGIAPGFNNDGQAIVYAAADGIHRMMATGAANHLIVRASFPWQFTQPTWSPDGKRVAFIRRDSATAASLCYVVAYGGSVSVLTSAPVGIEGPAWSRDSVTLSYARFDGIGAEGRRSTTVYRQVIGGQPAAIFRPAGLPITDLATWTG